MVDRGADPVVWVGGSGVGGGGGGGGAAWLMAGSLPDSVRA
ncbi:hypothetical protein OH802_09295 [Nocardioides sp. NBC_00850]|nr:hypothetical protein OH802_09295 [Nocardioides sp. NBC_00850]